MTHAHAITPAQNPAATVTLAYDDRWRRRARLTTDAGESFLLDLPEATVAIQVSGAFGSRQEEAQRLGRLLRPKESGRTASFYTLIARDTVDQDFAQNRQRFLAEQGYAYRIVDADDVIRGAAWASMLANYRPKSDSVSRADGTDGPPKPPPINRPDRKTPPRRR